MIVYLASPYTGTEREMVQRFQQVAELAAEMMDQGIIVFSPIAHTHPIALAGDLPRDWEFWKRYDEAMLKACGHLVVATEIEGWDMSKGVSAEIEIANDLGLDIFYGVQEYLKHMGGV